MPRWLPDSFDPDAHNARVRSLRSDMREADSAHRIVGTDGCWDGATPLPATVAGAAAPPPARRPSSAAPAAVPAPIYPLVGMCRAAGLPEPVPEYRFHPQRKWRMDFSWPLHRVAVEINGGVWTQGRHTRGAGYLADMAKRNAAALLGWRTLEYAPDQLGQAIADLRIMFAGEA